MVENLLEQALPQVLPGVLPGVLLEVLLEVMADHITLALLAPMPIYFFDPTLMLFSNHLLLRLFVLQLLLLCFRPASTLRS